MQTALAWPIATDQHGIGLFCEEGAIYNRKCPYILLSIGKASHQQGVELYMPPDGKNAYFQFPTILTHTSSSLMTFITGTC